MRRCQALRPQMTYPLFASALVGLCAVAPPTRASDDNTPRPLPAACLGVEASAAGDPLFERRHVVGVEPLTTREGKQQLQVTRGATLSLIPAVGDSPELLERMMQCEQATTKRDGQSDGPLALASVQVSVRPGDGVFLVRLESADKKTAREVLARAERAYERSKSARRGG